MQKASEPWHCSLLFRPSRPSTPLLFACMRRGEFPARLPEVCACYHLFLGLLKSPSACWRASHASAVRVWSWQDSIQRARCSWAKLDCSLAPVAIPLHLASSSERLSPSVPVQQDKQRTCARKPTWDLPQ